MKRLSLLGVSAALAAAGFAPVLSAHADVHGDGGDSYHPTNTIVGGTEAREGEFPEMVKLSITVPQGTAMCGGTLLSPDVVLTAQHCVEGRVSKVVAYIGKIDWHNGETIEGDINKMSMGAGPKRGDWAVVKLKSKAKSSSFTTLTKDASLDKSNSYLAAGWGRTSEKGSTSATLLKVTLPRHTGNKCASWDKYELCSGGNGQAGKDTCAGDSGGPLWVVSGGKRVQVGTTSWGVGCARADEPGHYGKLSQARTEILAAVKKIGGTMPSDGGPTKPTKTTKPTNTKPTKTKPTRPVDGSDE